MASYIEGRSFEYKDIVKLKKNIIPNKEYDYSEVHEYVKLPQNIYDELKGKLLYVEHAYSDHTLKLRVFNPEEDDIESPRGWDLANADIDYTFNCFFEKIEPEEWLKENSSNDKDVKLEVGDRVTVIDDLTKRLKYPYYNTALKKDKEVEIQPAYRTQYEGKVVQIAHAVNGKYKILQDNEKYIWVNSMFKETRQRFKPGDVAYVDPKGKADVTYRTYDRKNNRLVPMTMISQMAKFAGKQITIKSIDEYGAYRVEDGYGFSWCDSMLLSQEEFDDVILSSTVLPEEPVAKPATARPAGRNGLGRSNPFNETYRPAVATHIPSKIPMPAVDTNLNNNVKIKLTKNNEEERGNVKMNKMNDMLKRMFGEIGQVEDGSLALTFTGAVAIRRPDGDYVRYDAAGENIENQGDFILDGSDKMVFLMPSPTVAVGDIIKNGKQYNQVLAVKPNGSLTCVNFNTGGKTTIVKETNLFNMNFYTKVVSMMTGMTGGDTTPGGFNPMMLMAIMGDENKEMDLPMLMMVSGMFGGATQFNPMMMYFLMGKDKGGESKDMMSTMMMMSMFTGGQSPFGTMFGQPQQLPAPKQPEKEIVVDTSSESLHRIIEGQIKTIQAMEKKIAELTADKAAPKKTTTRQKKVTKENPVTE